jgi:predicted PurR-regulated permease PerM
LNRGIDWAKAYHQTATIALLLVLGYVLLQVVTYMADVVSILVSALLLAYVLQLVVDPLSLRMPRMLAVGMVVLGALVLLSAVAALLVPLVVTQVQDLVQSLPGALDRAQIAAQRVQEWLATRNFRANIDLEAWLMPRLQEASSYVTGNMGGYLASGFFSAFSIAMTLVCAFYFLLDSRRLWEGLSRLLPPPAALTLDYFRLELDKSLNNYFRGQVINASVVLAASTIVFNLLGMEYGVVGGLVWGVCEIIPMFGTYVGIGTCLLLALLQGGGIVWKVLLAALVIQQIKDNIISPRVMSATTGLHPVVIIAAVLTGMKLAGFLGILLAIPVTAVAVATLRVYVITGHLDVPDPVPSSGAVSAPGSVPAPAPASAPISDDPLTSAR